MVGILGYRGSRRGRANGLELENKGKITIENDHIIVYLTLIIQKFGAIHVPKRNPAKTLGDV
jgi:hypothetical protein